MTTAIRRTLFLLVLAALGGALYAWSSGRREPRELARPPEWPPLRVEPDAQRASDTSWVEPDEDGSCPDGYPVKVKASSGIYHVPGGRFHERTRPDRCYATAEAAEADGYRPSKS